MTTREALAAAIPDWFIDLRDDGARESLADAILAALPPADEHEHEYEQVRTGPDSVGRGACIHCGHVWTILPADEATLDVEQLIRLAKDWRVSDEFIGIVVRSQVPREYARQPQDAE